MIIVQFAQNNHFIIFMMGSASRRICRWTHNINIRHPFHILERKIAIRCACSRFTSGVIEFLNPIPKDIGLYSVISRHKTFETLTLYLIKADIPRSSSVFVNVGFCLRMYEKSFKFTQLSNWKSFIKFYLLIKWQLFLGWKCNFIQSPNSIRGGKWNVI